MNGPINTNSSSSIVSSNLTNSIMDDKIKRSSFSKMDNRKQKMNTSSTTSSSLCHDDYLLKKSLPSLSSSSSSSRGHVDMKYNVLLKRDLQKILNIPPYLLFFILFINYVNPDIILVELIFFLGRMACQYPISSSGGEANSNDSEATFSTRSFSVCSTYSSSTIHSLESAFHSCGSTSSMYSMSSSRMDSYCSSTKADTTATSSVETGSSYFAQDTSSSCADFRSSFSNDLLTPASFIPVMEGSGDVDEWGHFTDFDESPSSSFLPMMGTSSSSSTLSDPFHSLEKSVLRRRGEKLSICRLDQLREENECEDYDDW